MTSALPSKPRPSRTLAGVLRRHQASLAALLVLSLLINLLMLTGPLFMLQVYDRVLASQSVGTLLVLAGFAGLLYVFMGVFDLLRSRVAVRAADHAESEWRAETFRQDIESRFVRTLSFDPARESEALRMFIAGPGLTSLLDVPWAPLYVAVVFLIHGTLGWLAVLGVILVTALLVFGELTSRNSTRRLADVGSERQAAVEGARRGAETVKAMGMTAHVVEKLSRQSREVAAAQCEQVDRMSIVSSVSKTIRFALQSGVLAVGAYLVIQGEISAGAMIAASIVTSRALAPVEQVVAHWRTITAGHLGWVRLNTIYDAGAGNPSHSVVLARPRQSLRVRNLVLRSEDSGRVLAGPISFALQAGDGLGILGPTGAGKTTLLRGIAGVWPAHHGEVRLDESELRHFDETSRGAIIGYLSQQVDLFDGTIAENISRGIPDADGDAILSASAAASAHEMIASLPEGYDTKVGREGIHLSAGQRQRIGLARALYGDPFLVLLDEPSSNLDADGDAALSRALAGVRDRGGIVIVISHRPSTVQQMNKLLVLEQGAIRVFGDREDVLSGGQVVAT